LPLELLLLGQICAKSFVSWSFAPDPTGGAYSAPPGKGMREGSGQRREGKGWSPGMPKSIVDKPSRNYIE